MRSVVAPIASLGIAGMLVVFAVLPVVSVPPALALGPCCNVIAVNPKTQVVTAKHNKLTGLTFRFVVKDPNLIKRVKVGQAVGFDRRTGLSVQGLPNGCCKPILRSLPPPPGSSSSKAFCQDQENENAAFLAACGGGAKFTDPDAGFWDEYNAFCENDPSGCLFTGPKTKP